MYREEAQLPRKLRDHVYKEEVPLTRKPRDHVYKEDVPLTRKPRDHVYREQTTNRNKYIEQQWIPQVESAYAQSGEVKRGYTHEEYRGRQPEQYYRGYEKQNPPPRNPNEYTWEPRQENIDKEPKVTNPKVPTDRSDQNLFEWGKWRTQMNGTIIKDVIKARDDDVHDHSLGRLARTSDGYVSLKKDTKVHGDPTYIMSYSLATNNATDLSPKDFLAYGIPRAKIDVNMIKSEGLPTEKKDSAENMDITDNEERDESQLFAENQLYLDDERIDTNIEITPRTDYSPRMNAGSTTQDVASDENKNGPTEKTPNYEEMPKDKHGNNIPESLRKVFANNTGDYQPVLVLPPPPPPPPPPAPPIPMGPAIPLGPPGIGNGEPLS